MIDLKSESGVRAEARLRVELVAWLVTVDAHGTPAPTPVWFLWDGETVLIYSQPEKPKLRCLASNPRVALALRTDERGGALAVITGKAAVDAAAPPADQLAAYLEKYRTEIALIGSDPAAFAAEYSVPIRIRPTRLRTW